MSDLDNSNDIFLDEDESQKDLEMKVNYSYPDNPDFEYVSFLERIDFEKEKLSDLQKNKGFIISASKSTKKEVKNPNGKTGGVEICMLNGEEIESKEIKLIDNGNINEIEIIL